MFKHRLIGDNDYVFDIQGTILKNRNISDVEKFMNPDKKVEIHFSKLKNIQKAVDCLDKHIENKNKIFIVTDPDVDGFTSGSIIYQYLKLIDDALDVSWSVHNDKVHGLEGIEIPADTNLIITPDSATNDFELHKKYADLGMDIIVLDHHEAEGESEHAIVVNPQLGGYSNFNLSGAGVTYKFCQALDDNFWCEYADNFLDLVALGNIADSMDMTELETRYYVEKGLKDINNDFFRALLRQQEYSTKGKINITTISFYVAPLINAVIRVGTLEEKVDLFKAFIGTKELVKYKPRGSDEILVSLVDDMARRCTNIKAKQKRMVDKITKEVEELIEKEQLHKNQTIIIHGIDSMESGLSGLIAMQICSKYKKPTFMLSEKKPNGNYKGSARGYDKGELKELKTVVENTGAFELAKGHLQAFGIEIKEENIPVATKKLNELLSDYSFEDIYDVDFAIPANSMSGDMVMEICELENLWGKGVEEPYILIEKIPVIDAELTLMGSKEDTISIYHNDIKYIMFKRSKEIFEEIENAKYISIVGKASINEYKDNKYPQIIVSEYNLYLD